MSYWNKVFLYATLAAASLLGLPVAAQVEVSPDHFPDQTSDQSTGQPSRAVLASSLSKSQTEISAHRAALDDYYKQIGREIAAVDEARDAAIGAGALGDGASIFVDAYLQERRALDELRARLEPKIAQEQAAINALQEQLAGTSDHTPVFLRRQSPADAHSPAPGKVIAASAVESPQAPR